jgi:hypothetical protein
MESKRKWFEDGGLWDICTLGGQYIEVFPTRLSWTYAA